MREQGGAFVTWPVREQGRAFVTRPVREQGRAFVTWPVREQGRAFVTWPVREQRGAFVTHPVREQGGAFVTWPVRGTERSICHMSSERTIVEVRQQCVIIKLVASLWVAFNSNYAQYKHDFLLQKRTLQGLSLYISGEIKDKPSIKLITC